MTAEPMKNTFAKVDVEDPTIARTLAVEPVRNFHQVEPWLMRGGQPTAEGFKRLADMGIKTVVCLRWGPALIEAEKKMVEALGMKFVSIPLNYWNLPTTKVIDQFFDLIDDPANHSLYVHCFHGADRTGLLCAIYRMARNGYSFEDAYREMKACGFHRFRIRHFKWWLREYAERERSPRSDKRA